MDSSRSSTALVCGGGGARTAYQAGVLRYIGEAVPEAELSIVTGVGAGGLNATLLAGQQGSWSDAARSLAAFWDQLSPERVFRARSLWDLVTQLVRHAPSARQSLLDPEPLRDELTDALATDGEGGLIGVERNVDTGWLEALAFTTTHYGALETVTWTQGGRVNRTAARRSGRETTLTVDHVMASLSLALLYPAVAIEGEWHGAGVGLLHPMAPARELGAHSILGLSTRSAKISAEEGGEEPYPSPLQVASILSNTLLLDPIATDVNGNDRAGCERKGSSTDGEERADVLLIRPSVDLTAVARRLDVEIGTSLGTVLQYLHGEGTHLPDLLSMLLYEPRYLRRLLLIGYEDARRQHGRLEDFLRG